MDAGAAADQAASTQIAELQLGVSRNEDAARRNRGGIARSAGGYFRFLGSVIGVGDEVWKTLDSA
jgi:hypothetical protein